MANRALDSQVARDVLAAALVFVGVVATSWGAFLVSPTVGFLVVGGECLALGVALGWGEREGEEGAREGGAQAGAREEGAQAGAGSTPKRRTGLRLVAEEGPAEPNPEPAPTESASARARPQAPVGPTFVPVASYLGGPLSGPRSSRVAEPASEPASEPGSGADRRRRHRNRARDAAQDGARDGDQVSVTPE